MRTCEQANLRWYFHFFFFLFAFGGVLVTFCFFLLWLLFPAAELDGSCDDSFTFFPCVCAFFADVVFFLSFFFVCCSSSSDEPVSLSCLVTFLLFFSFLIDSNKDC